MIGDGLTFTRLGEANVLRLNSVHAYEACQNWDARDWLLALTGEVGELANIIKKVNRGDYDEYNNIPVEEVENEIADIAIYLSLLAKRLNIDLSAVIIRKFNQSSEKVGSKVFLGLDGKIVGT